MPKYCRPSEQKPGGEQSCIACYETRGKGDMEEGLFPLALFSVARFPNSVSCQQGWPLKIMVCT